MNTDKAVHLGHSLSTDNNDSIVNSAIAQFWRYFNLLSANSGHISPICNVNRLSNSLEVFYGAPLWLLSSQIVNKACTAWRKSLKTMWRLSPMAHCDAFTLLSDCIPLEVPEPIL